MAINAAEIETRMEAAIVLIEAADYAGARTKLLTIKGMMSVIPDGREGMNEISFDRAALDELIQQTRDLDQAKTTGLQLTKINRIRPTSC